MPINLPDVSLWIPPKPAIIRKVTPDLLPPEDVRNVRQGAFAGAPFSHKNRPFIAAIGTPATGSGDAVSVSPPAAGEKGDVLVCFISTENGNITGPSGYTEMSNSPQGNGVFASSTRASAYAKVHSGTESAVTCGLFGSHTVAVILAIRNCRLTPNVSGGSNAGSSTSVTVPGITTTKPWCLVLKMVAFSVNTTAGSWTNANLFRFAEIVDVATTDDDDGGLAIAAGYKIVAGATGNTTATLANASTQGRLSYAFECL